MDYSAMDFEKNKKLFIKKYRDFNKIGNLMPIIRVEMWEGRTTEQKKELVEVLSKETARITGCEVTSIYVIIDDIKKENWGAGGQLCSEKYSD